MSSFAKHKHLKDAILKVLDENYKDKMDKLVAHISQNKYFDKGAVDRWFFNDIKDKNIIVKSDDYIYASLNSWYNKNKLCIIKSRLFRSTISKLYNCRCECGEYILVPQEVQREIYEQKFNKKSFKNLYYIK